MSSTDSSEASTRAHCAIQAGKASKCVPTRLFMTSYFTSTASAGRQVQQTDEEQRPGHRGARPDTEGAV
jgi:hypothetical protein